MSSNEWLIMAMSMLISTMMMATWYRANRNIPTPSTTDVAWFPPGNVYAYSLSAFLFGYLISTLSTLTSPNIDQNKLKSVRGNLNTHTHTRAHAHQYSFIGSRQHIIGTPHVGLHENVYISKIHEPIQVFFYTAAGYDATVKSPTYLGLQDCSL